MWRERERDEERYDECVLSLLVGCCGFVLVDPFTVGWTYTALRSNALKLSYFAVTDQHHSFPTTTTTRRRLEAVV